MTAYAVPKALIPARIAEVYETAVAISPTDATAIGPFMALYIGVAGDVTLVPRNSTTAVLFKAVPVGVLKVACQGVNSTGTTATNIVGLG